jgi:hypothetical protein
MAAPRKAPEARASYNLQVHVTPGLADALFRKALRARKPLSRFLREQLEQIARSEHPKTTTHSVRRPRALP